ncbi:hypothetical protein D1007_31813 [Hordeum vulgare]|nr:hypothetical protein D1007_31813 [Hordeum vulgare]
MHTKRISSDTAMKFGVHLVQTHMRKMDVTVMYTNDPIMVEESINTMERLLAEDDKYKLVLNSLESRFATVDTTNDPKVLKTSGMACKKLVDIHGHYKIWGTKKYMDSHVELVEAIIDPYYEGMKAECEKNKAMWHMAWLKRLDEHHLQTMAKEAYTCYDMFRWIVDMRKFLLPEYTKRSSYRQSGGGKHYRK